MFVLAHTVDARVCLIKPCGSCMVPTQDPSRYCSGFWHRDEDLVRPLRKQPAPCAYARLGANASRHWVWSTVSLSFGRQSLILDGFDTAY